jgi:hypothetical protein
MVSITFHRNAPPSLMRVERVVQDGDELQFYGRDLYGYDPFPTSARKYFVAASREAGRRVEPGDIIHYSAGLSCGEFLGLMTVKREETA